MQPTATHCGHDAESAFRHVTRKFNICLSKVCRGDVHAQRISCFTRDSRWLAAGFLWSYFLMSLWSFDTFWDAWRRYT